MKRAVQNSAKPFLHAETMDFPCTNEVHFPRNQVQGVTDMIPTPAGLWVPDPAHMTDLERYNAYVSKRDAPRPQERPYSPEYEFKRATILSAVVWIALLSLAAVVGYGIVTAAIGMLAGLFSAAAIVGKWVAYFGGMVCALLLLGVVLQSIFSRERHNDTPNGDSVTINQTVYYQNKK